MRNPVSRRNRVSDSVPPPSLTELMKTYGPGPTGGNEMVGVESILKRAEGGFPKSDR